jgi:N-acetylmuramoyl-L-alanine amidase
MTTKTKYIGALALVILVAAGCGQPQKATPAARIREQTITLEELATRLRMRIEERDATFVVMRNAANTVIVFTHSDGRYFVNGKPVGSVGPVQKSGNTTYVLAALVDQIESDLRNAPPQTPPVVVPPRRPTPKARLTVVVDAGHGGQDPGTLASGNLQEKDINLSVARKVAALLEQRGIGVIMTRSQDRFIELEERAAIANQHNADLFVSIHSDSAPNRSVEGFTVYVSRAASPDSRQAAQAILRSMSATGSDNHGVREADYRVLVNTTCPAVLVELGYLSNAADARRLGDNSFQNRLAQAITDGILTCLQ